ncbi:hypothetical protein KAR91_84855 [Candidatus Pacearchaeota archaeon]|nr:hypothetical protein [Candidatus Pacearchaeota archaeon]
MRVPPGGIIIWSGSIVDIPNGFVLCDGTLGTPDLRNRFVIGAGDIFAVDAAGGNSTHDHDFTSNGHNHDLPGGGDLSPGSGISATSSTETDSGTTDVTNHLPPYYALAYIMKT